MRRTLTGRALAPVLLLAAAIPATSMAVITAMAAPGAAASTPHTPFGLSGLPAQSRGPKVAPGLASPGTPSAPAPSGSGPGYHAAPQSAAFVKAGPNVDVIGGSDVAQQGTINGVSVSTCNPGKDAAQNETTIASNGSTLIGGTNDYRLYEPSENRYDSSGGVYRSTDGGKTWAVGFLPGLVRASTASPGPYESAGDPAVASGTQPNVFWYANLAFNRSDAANSVAVSRTADGGRTWSTHFVVQTSAADGATIFNDKEWIGADPSDRSGRTAYVTWTLFEGNTSAIVISKTTDGGRTWSAPHQVSDVYVNDQGSTVVVSKTGTVYVTFEALDPATNAEAVAFAASTDGGATFTTRVLDPVNDIPSPLPGATFRDDSFPVLALDGRTLHVVWSDWNGTDADILYTRSTDGGANWSAPAIIGGGPGDQIFPWVAASRGTVYASWLSRSSGDTYTAAGAASASNGARWSAPATLSTAVSDAMAGNFFGFPNCAASFIGDYTGLTVDANGVGHALWTDIRADRFDAGGADQDPFTAALTAIP
jgi:hypothetical protein